MFYRYEGRHSKDEPWVGIFAIFNPSQRRKWYCLTTPQWYAKNPDVDSKAWFTQHGYEKWHTKMEEMIEEISGFAEVRLIKRKTLDNVVVKGKTQVIQKIITSNVA